MTDSHSMIIGFQINCRSLNTNLGELKVLIYSNQPEFVLISETWINKNSKYLPKFLNYKAIWKHRETGMGGGLCILIKDGVQYQTLDLVGYANGILEFQGIRIFKKNSGFFDLFHIYNPNKNLTIQELKHYLNQLGSQYIIAGDFNAHTRILSDNDHTANPTGRTIENILQNEPIYLINPTNFYTYLNLSTLTKSCLDLCFSSPNLRS